MRIIIVGSAFLAAVAIVFLLRRLSLAPSPAVILSQGPTIEKLERLSQLVSLRLQVADILVAAGQGCRGCWVIKGDAALAVDLSRAKIADKSEDTKQATIILPQPTVLQPRVDHSRTRTWSVERVAWLPWNADQDALRDAVYAEAQRLVEHTAASSENIQAAKRAAETTIKAIYAEVGWTLVVKWDGESGSDPKAPAAH